MLRFSLSYLSIPRGASALQDEDRQELQGSMRLGLSRYWTLALSGTESFATSETLSSGVAAIYQDECLAFIASLTQSANRDRDLTPGTSILVSLVFKNLGELVTPVFQESPTVRPGQ
jgi:LPS-assembly protein